MQIKIISVNLNFLLVDPDGIEGKRKRKRLYYEHAQDASQDLGASFNMPIGMGGLPMKSKCH